MLHNQLFIDDMVISWDCQVVSCIVIKTMLTFTKRMTIMKNYWFTSDWHLHHKNILKFTKRPYSSLEDMHEAYIEWNNKNVSENDEVWNLGDLTFGQLDVTKSILKRLKGKHHLVLGNHDINISNHRNELLREGLLASVHQYKELKIDRQKLILFHYPMRSWNNSNYGSFHLFGHVHGNMEPFGKSVDVGIDSEYITGNLECRPFHYDEIVKFMMNRKIEKDYMESK